jgi:hypothetical protein
MLNKLTLVLILFTTFIWADNPPDPLRGKIPAFDNMLTLNSKPVGNNNQVLLQRITANTTTTLQFPNQGTATTAIAAVDFLGYGRDQIFLVGGLFIFTF